MTNITEFASLFMEECSDRLSELESELIVLEQDPSSREVLNAAFRSMHSIKGASGSFGAKALMELAHAAEALLDLGRAEMLDLGPHCGELLRSVDVAKDLLERFQAGDSAGTRDSEALTRAFSDLVERARAGSAAPFRGNIASPEQPSEWEVCISEGQQLFRGGMDPRRLFRELADFADIEIRCDTRAVPPLSELEPETCYLSWRIKVPGTVQVEQIQSVFEWIEDECTLTISAIGPEEDVVEEPQITQDGPQVEGHDRHALAGLRQFSRATASRESIRIQSQKLETLFQNVGTLVSIEQGLVSEVNLWERGARPEARKLIEALSRNSRHLQELVGELRMHPVGQVFGRMRRVIADAARLVGKKARLETFGEQTELDKGVLEKLADPLTHMLRNSVDHGLESSETRVELGKPEHGTIELGARHSSGNIVIEIRDDGAGLDEVAIRKKARESGVLGADTMRPEELIFSPGFSTAKAVTELSGRGVGLDVVKRNIEALGGRVSLSYQAGQGSCFRLTLPLTQAIIPGQFVMVRGERYVLPVASIVESQRFDPILATQLPGGHTLYSFRDERIPVVYVEDKLFGGRESRSAQRSYMIVMLRAGDGFRALVVDLIQEQQQVVLKNIEVNCGAIPGIAGATVMSSGEVALVLDPDGLFKIHERDVRSVCAGTDAQAS